MEKSEQNIDAISVVKSTWEVFSNNARVFAALALIEVALVLLLIPAARSAQMLFLLVLIGIVYVSLLVDVSILRQSIAAARGKQITMSISEMLKDSHPYIGGYFLVSLAVGLVIAGGFILLIVPGILFMFWYAVSLPARVDGSDSVRAAMSRSKQLTKGNYGTIFALFIAVVLVSMVISAFTNQTTGGMNTGAEVSAGPNLIGSVLLVLLGILTAIGVAVLYAALDESKKVDEVIDEKPGSSE